MPPNRENGRHRVPIPPLFAPEAISKELARCLNELVLEMRARQIPEDRLWGQDGILETLMYRQNEFSGINRPYLRLQVVEEAIRRLRLADDQPPDADDQPPEADEQPRETSIIAIMLGVVAVVAVGLLAAFFTSVFRTVPPDTTSVDGVIKDACDLHVRWSHATSVPPAQVDLYSVLGSEEAAFSGSIDEFAARFSELMGEDHCAVSEMECRTRTTIAIRVLEFLRDRDNRHVYDTTILPLVRKKKAALKNLCGW